MDIYLNRILNYSTKYAHKHKRNIIKTSDIAQAMQHQGGALDLTGDINFCGGKITQCYDPPKSCMSGGTRRLIKKRLKYINPKYKLSDDSLEMLQNLFT